MSPSPCAQRDRDQLINTVSYTKGQATNMVSMVHGVNTQFARLQKEVSVVS